MTRTIFEGLRTKKRTNDELTISKAKWKSEHQQNKILLDETAKP